MSKNIIYGKGAPQKDTQARMGDVYCDDLTNLKYLCIFAYRDGTEENFECEWKIINEEIQKGVSKKEDITTIVSNGEFKSSVNHNSERVSVDMSENVSNSELSKNAKEVKGRSYNPNNKKGYTSYGKMN